MSDFDKWFFNTGGDCYGSNSEEYKISKVTWDYQQKKIDAVLNFVNGYDDGDIDSNFVLKSCVVEIKEILND